MDDFLEKKPKKHSDAASATAARFSWVVVKDFARRRFPARRRYARITARMHIFARIYATKQSRTKSLATNIGTIPKNMPTNFQLKRLKLKLDIVKKPENRVHELTGEEN